MSDDDTNGTRTELFRVGDIAAAAGLTVRALHHYEEIGLVAPSTRSAAGHRLYGPDAVQRLYVVNRLRRLGLSLEQVRRTLDDPDWSLANALRHHLDAADRELQVLTTLRTALTQRARRRDRSPDRRFDQRFDRPTNP